MYLTDVIFTVYSLLMYLQYDVHTIESGQGVHIPEDFTKHCVYNVLLKPSAETKHV